MLPCEYASRYILPSIRRAIAIELHRMGMRKGEIARILHTTPAAISQYLSGKRGRDIPKRELIHWAIQRILAGEDAGRVICSICREVRERAVG